MSYTIRPLDNTFIQELLTHIPQPPKSLYIRGTLCPMHHKLITIVGSRKCSEYSKQVIEEICTSLKNQPVTLISGLAVGVDSYVHKQAIKNNIHTIAVVGSGLEDKVLYPQSNVGLAKEILDHGGALISEQNPTGVSRVWMFPARNRIMVGLSSLVIIVEAREKSGTLITARLAIDYNRDLLVVPNSIYSPYSKGSNELIKQGAYMYTCPDDLYQLLGFESKDTIQHSLFIPTPDQKIILNSISNGNATTQSIIDSCSDKLAVSQIIQTLLYLEIEGVIKKLDGVFIRT